MKITRLLFLLCICTFRSFGQDCGFTFTLSANDTDICIGNSVDISMSDSEVGIDYNLVDVASSTIIATITSSPGGSITFAGISPLINTTYKVTAGNPVVVCDYAAFTETVTVNQLPDISLTSSNENQTLCINTVLTNITFSIANATGATVSGLPAGVTGSYSAGTFTISGTPTVSGSFNYTVTTTGGCSPDDTYSGTIDVTPAMTLLLTSANNNQTVCVNTAISAINYSVGNATGASASGLPAGVTGSYSAGVFTISGTPTASGTFNYTVTTSGGCTPAASLGGTITVTPAMTLALTSANSNQTVCVNTAIPAINYSVGNATGASASGLPAGVTGSYSAGVFTISGTPTASGTFNYTVTTSGGCNPAASLGGTITVTPAMTLALTSANSNQTVCVNTAISAINYSVGNATGASASGLPAGVTGNYSAGVFTISGTPTASGTFNYTVTTSGGCNPAASLGGTITVTPAMTLTLTSANNNQTRCVTVAIANITYSVGNATGASASGLPAGVTGNYSTGVFTISGAPTVTGTFNYTVTTSGGCSPAASLGGTITVPPAMSLSLTSANNNQTVCINAAIANITYNVGNATGASASGLPAGVAGNYSGGVFTISGTPTVSGTFNYTVTTSGGCNPAASSGGTITVNPAMTLTLTTANNNQTVCINTGIANIRYTVGNGTGATVVGLPAGLTGSYNPGPGTYTISGTPTVSGVFNYTVSPTGGCNNPSASLSGTITVTPAMTLALTSANNTQTICINTPIVNITYSVGNATGASASGLPAGVTGNYSAGVFTISGTPTASGNFNYTVTTSGGCNPAASLGGTITVTPAMTLALTSGNNNQTRCINVAIANITYNVGNSTGASASGLPAGVTGNYSAGVFTISGTPTASGTFNYAVTTTGGCNPAASLGGTITVTPAMTLSLTSANNTQTVCINTPIVGITYSVGNATGASASGLPAGVTGSYSAGVFTISGSPTASGTFNYTVTTSGGCNPAASLGGTITVTPAMTLTLTTANNTQTRCINVAIANITYTVGNATGASASGLPAGVTGNYSAGVFTISGSPTASGTFNYTVTTSGGCNPAASLGGTITVTPAMTIALTSANNVQTRCINVAIANITYSVGNSTGASASGLPAGITGNYSAGVFTISGSPTASGTFNYTVTTTGGCNPAASLGGTITVTPAMTLALTSANNTQTICINTPIVNITYSVGNATGASASGLPAGVTGNYSAGMFTISGTPTASGTFNYTVTTSGGCNPAASLGGTITVTPAMTLALTSGNNNQTRCINVAIANITYTVGNSTGASASGLPAGVTGNYNAGVFTISGSPTVSGTFNYSVTTTGGCNPAASLGGTITVTPAMTLALTSANNVQTRCINVAIANITYSVGNATGASASGLPAGVTGSYSAGVFTITGSPTASGTFNYTVTTSGGCNPAASLGGTITVTPAMTIALTSANNVQTRCINVAIASITYNVGNATGASASGLPAGVTGNYSAGVFTISGTPTASGTFNYTVTTSGGCNPAASLGGTITVTPAMTIALTSANNVQTRCINVAIANITYSVGNSTGASASGLPAGVTGNYSAGVFTISGSPTASGTFNYTVTTTGGCNPAASLGGTITVTPAMTLTLTSANNNQTRCINVAVANITYNVANATGASASGLPAGVTGSYSAGVFTISGTPTASGTFNYTVTTSGGCNPAASLGGTITVTPAMTLALTSANNNQTRCINVAIANIMYSVGNSTGASVSGLPAGVTGNYSAGVFTISGSPTASGTFNYTVTTTGGCNPAASLGGTITVTPAMTLTLTSANNTQTVCNFTPIVTITYSVGNATGASASGLPAGVTGSYSSGVFTISGSPTVFGTFNYTVSTSGGCNPVASLGGTITSIQESIDGAVTVSQPGVTPVVTIITHCHSGSGTLYLSGHVGAVLRWEYSTNGGFTWIAVDNTSDTYDYANLTQSTVFRAVVQNTGLCSIAYSASSMVNVIPNIKPNPVTATPPIICNGQSSVLTSQSGFATSQNLATGGTFNDANPAGWGTDGQFTGNYLSSSGSNTNENPFALSASNNGTYSGILCGSTGKFAIVHGDIWGAPNNGTSYMETMAFSTFGLSSANLQFNHAYRLYPGANIKIELSLNGGSSYPITLYTQTGSAPYVEQTPFNIFTTLLNLNLDAYIGQPNMRIKFTYFSNNTDSLWVLDNISIPQAPVGLTTEWVDVSTNTVISNSSTVTVSPSVTTTYGVTSLLNGCASTGPDGTTYVTVTVNPRPTANIGTSQTICNNTSTTLTVNLTGTAPWSITYSDGTTSITVNNVNTNPYIITTPILTASKTYTITALSDANCVSIPVDLTGSAVITVLNGTVGLWTGLVSDDWFDCLNWAGGIPTINDDAVIPAGVPNMPVIAGSGSREARAPGIATARDLIVNTNASLTMSSGSMLQIGRNWRNSGVFNYGAGTVEFVGSTLNQVQLINTGIKTNEAFYNMTLRNTNGAKGVNLPDTFELTVENNLTLESGDLRLTGEAQLVQLGEDSNPLTGTGKLLRDQQGTKSSRHYNYWSSPVSNDNVNYSLGTVLKDGTDVTTNPFGTTNIFFGTGYDFADGPVTNPIRVSRRWLYKYSPSNSGYNGWIAIGETGNIKAGEGYTMKGVDGTTVVTNSQNYVFTGKPNNGDINLVFGAGQRYLVGNPYASALDANEFILDNIKDGGRATTNVMNGALYFWDHFGGYSHFLADYVGGYATYTLMGGVVAVSNDPTTANTGQSGSKIPKRYIPVAQGFFISSSIDNNLVANNPNLTSPVTGGTLKIKNNQRKFARETGGSSIFIRPGDPIDDSDGMTDKREKIRILFQSPSGTFRQLLAGADASASNYYDIGYDALMVDAKPEDMYWQFGTSKLIIQAVSDFNPDQKVPIGIKIETPGTATVKIDNLENIAADKGIYIYDELTGVSHDLRASNFTVSLAKGEYLNRFSLRFKNQTVNDDLTGNMNVYFAAEDHTLNIINNKSVVQHVYLFNMIGQLADQPKIEQADASDIKLPLNNLAEGVYIVKISTKEGVYTKKIIIE